MDHVAELIAAFSQPSATDRQWPSYDAQNGFKIGIVQQLEDLEDPRVLPFFLSVLADYDEFDLARIEILELLGCKACTRDEREAIWPVVIPIALHDPDEVVRSYAAMALRTYQDVPQVAAAAEAIVRDGADDCNVRFSAFDIVERIGPTEQVIALLSDLRSDAEFASTANRLLKKWGPTEIYTPLP